MKKDVFEEKITNYAKELWILWYEREVVDLLDEEVYSKPPNKEKSKYKGTNTTKTIDVSPEGIIRRLRVIFNVFTKPSLNWNKIRKAVRELKINNKELEDIIFSLEPTPLNQTLRDDAFKKKERRLKTDILNYINGQIKNLSPLVKKLENHPHRCFGSFHQSTSLSLTIEELRFEIEVYRKMVKIDQKGVKDSKKSYLAIFGEDRKSTKSLQKYRIWNDIVSVAIKILNPYCHNNNCYFDGKLDCKKTHEKTYKIIAKLLKILYPNIWKEDINTIAKRIKQKDYRQL